MSALFRTEPFVGMIVAVLLVFSIILHELAHGYVALKCGDSTALYSGRLTLNPMAHFDIFGFLMLITVGFGFARPVPINPSNFRNYKKGYFLVSIAGVTVNIILAFLLLGISYGILFLLSKFEQSALFEFFRIMLLATYYTAFFNLSLCFFNLLPIFPLDGFRVAETLTKYTNPVIRFLRNYGSMIMLALFGIHLICDMFGLPWYMNPLSIYFRYTADLVFDGFNWFWKMVFGV